MSLITDHDLNILFTHADVEDIGVLIDHITDSGEGRISLSSDTCKRLNNAKLSGQITEQDRAVLAEELMRFGGNSIMNLLRGGSGVSYNEIVCDVASRVKTPYNNNASCADIEVAILTKVLEQSLERMTDRQKEDLFGEFGAKYSLEAGPVAMTALIAAIRTSGLAAYKLTVIVANSAARALLGRGLSFAGNAAITRGIGVFAGPIGWALTAIWTAFDLTSPAYRVTFPCVVQIAYMRQKALLKQCINCNAPIQNSAKFCSECGASVQLTDQITN